MVNRSVRELAERLNEVVEDQGLDFPEKVRRFIELRTEMLSRIRRPLVHDVQRNFPALWRQVEEKRRAGLEASFSRLVEEWVRKGIFRPEIDPAMLEMVYTSAITGIVNPDNLSRVPYTAGEATDAVMNIIFTGVLTDKARKRFPVQAGKHQKG